MKKRKIPVRMILLIAAILIGFASLLTWGYRIGYWLYYKPLYALFPDNMYLPYYLHIAFTWAGYIGIAVLAVCSFSIKPRKLSLIASAIVMGTIGIVMTWFYGRDAYRDIKLIEEKRYLTAECNVNTLRKYYSGHKSTCFEICIVEKTSERRENIRMNFYQYRELLKIQKEDGNKIVTVYYLPNTRRMLKYE